MTTIAYKDGVLAFDGQATSNGLVMGLNTVKGVATDTLLAASSGDSAFGAAFLAWVKEGMNPEKAPKTHDNKTDDIAAFTVDRKGRVTEYFEGLLPCYLGKKQFHASGSGREIAIGAMAAGATAQEAVKIASQFDTNTGGRIRTLQFED